MLRVPLTYVLLCSSFVELSKESAKNGSKSATNGPIFVSRLVVASHFRVASQLLIDHFFFGERKQPGNWSGSNQRCEIYSSEAEKPRISSEGAISSIAHYFCAPRLNFRAARFRNWFFAYSRISRSARAPNLRRYDKKGPIRAA